MHFRLNGIEFNGTPAEIAEILPSLGVLPAGIVPAENVDSRPKAPDQEQAGPAKKPQPQKSAPAKRRTGGSPRVDIDALIKQHSAKLDALYKAGRLTGEQCRHVANSGWSTGDKIRQRYLELFEPYMQQKPTTVELDVCGDLDDEGLLTVDDLIHRLKCSNSRAAFLFSEWRRTHPTE